MLAVKIRSFCCLAMLGLFSSAFAGTTAYNTGYLQDYHRLGHVGGVPLEQVWIEPEFDVREYRILYIAPVQIDPLAYRRHGEPDRQIARRMANAIRKELECQLQAAGIFAVVTTDPYFYKVHDQALTLETRITEIGSGNPNARVFLGFGAGATEVQIEGKVFEHKYCRTLAEFADRRLHPGGSILWGPELTANSEYLIGADVKQILRGVLKLFIFLREEVPPHRQR